MTDEQLVLQFNDGDETALVELIERYKPMLSKITRSYFLIGWGPEDLMQEAMIGLVKACKGYKQTMSSFSTFAYQCITRNVQSAVKTANRKKNMVLNNSMALNNQGAVKITEEDEEITIMLPSSALTPDEKLIESEKLQEVKQQIIQKLSKFELEVLALYLKGFSYTSIADKLDLPPKSIDNALSRIKNKLSYLKK